MTHLRLGALALLGVLVSAATHAQTRGGQWRTYGGDSAATRYSPLDQIDKSNVAKLGIAWQRPAVDASILAAAPRLRPEPWFRAFDKQTGAVLAEVKLPAGTTGAPITYMHAGKQYIVVAIGGRDLDPEWVALSLR